jgi:DNA-binding MurR/RpiR family transcriptional regulator
LPVVRCRRSGNENTGEKREGRVDLFGERFRARAHQLSPRLLAVVSYINENREVVLERTAMEIAAATQTSDATVVRAIQALGFAGLRELKQTMERWFGPAITSSEKMLSTVNALSCDVNSSIDFVLEGHQRACEVLSRPANRAAVAQAVALLSEARQVAIFGIGASGILAEYTGRLFSRIGTLLRAQPHRFQPCRAADRPAARRCDDDDGPEIAASRRDDRAA